MSGVSKITADRNQRILLDLVAQPGNDICADCKSKAPRWASHNLGIFLCVHCASIHRKIGTHVTKVKSLTLDSWTKEQVESMKTIGNIRANEYWNPDETKHPLPTNMEESERDSELEKYIRSKYQFKRFRPLAARAAEVLGPSQSLKSRTPVPAPSAQSSAVLPPARSHTAPIRSETIPAGSFTDNNRPPMPSAPSMEARSLSSGTGLSVPPRRSSYNPFPSTSTSTIPTYTPPAPAPAPPPNHHHQASLTSSTFNDLVSLQGPSLSSSLPLQYSQFPSQPQSQPQSQFQASQFQSQQFQAPMATGLNQSQSQPQAFTSSSPFSTPMLGSSNPYANLSANPTGMGMGFPASAPGPGSNFRSASLPVPGFGQSPMPTGSPGAFQQPFSAASNPFTQMQQQQQQQQFTGMPSSLGQPSPFYPQQQQQPFQPNAFQSPSPGIHMQNSPSPYASQAQQAQQLFHGMSGGGTNNPFGQWGGS